MGRRSDLLLDDKELLILQTKLAILVGDRQAIALQQIHYWLEINQAADKETHFFDDCWWAHNTWSEWHNKNFQFWAVPTIRRIFQDLEMSGLIITRPHENRQKGVWVTINYGELENQLRKFEDRPKVRRPARRQLKDQGRSDQNDQTGLIKTIRPSDQNDQTTGNTETTSEITSEVKDSAVTRHPDLIFDAVSLHIFGLKDSASVKGQTAGGRIGKINAWMKKNHPDATPEDLKRFADWCKSERFNPPKDLAKFADNFAVFVQNKGLIATSQGQSSTTGPRYGDRDAEGVCVWARIPGVGDGWMYVGKAE